MLSDEEKKAIHDLKILKSGIGILNCIPGIEKDETDIKAIDVVLNLIEKQSKEIEELKETLKCTQNSWYEDTKIIDKIKAEIEEARKKYNDLHTKHLRDCGIAEQRELAKIEFGQSLLEKE